MAKQTEKKKITHGPKKKKYRLEIVEVDFELDVELETFLAATRLFRKRFRPLKSSEKAECWDRIQTLLNLPPSETMPLERSTMAFLCVIMDLCT